MNAKEYQKAREKILRHYEKLEKQYIKQQWHGDMLKALQHEKHDALCKLTQFYYDNTKG